VKYGGNGPSAREMDGVVNYTQSEQHRTKRQLQRLHRKDQKALKKYIISIRLDRQSHGDSTTKMEGKGRSLRSL